MNNGRPHRIFYAVGPGDVVASFKRWSAREDVATETSITFSGQFFDYCQASGAETHVVSSHPSAQVLRSGNFVIENRPKSRPDAQGLAWHLDQRRYVRSLVASARDFRADVAIVDSGTSHWFMLSAFPAVGIPVIPSLHNSLWPIGFRPAGRLQRVIASLNARFWRRDAAATICVSPECKRQVTELAGAPRGHVFDYRAKFRPQFFDAFAPPASPSLRPFRILYAGRVEEGKGVLDLLDIAARVERERPGQCAWRICGGGQAEETLRRELASRDLRCVEFLGKLPRDALLAQYAWSQMVVVPTRSSFCEGLPLVAIEAVLAGRPLLTSRLSNALDVLGPAIVEAQPDDPSSYAAAVLRILDEPSSYAAAAAGITPELRAQFLRTDGGLADAVRDAISVALA